MTNERQDEIEKNEANDIPSGFHPVYMVELLFREQPIIDRMRLQNALTRYTGQVRLAVKQVNDQRSSQNKTDETETEIGKSEPSEHNLDMLVFYHMDHPVSFEEGNIPAQTCMLPVNGSRIVPDSVGRFSKPGTGRKQEMPSSQRSIRSVFMICSLQPCLANSVWNCSRIRSRQSWKFCLVMERIGTAATSWSSRRLTFSHRSGKNISMEQ